MYLPTIIRESTVEASIRLNTYRAMAALGGFILPLWGWLQYISGADVNEPLEIRIALSLFCLLFLAGSLFSRRFVYRIRPLAIVLYYLITAFAASLAIQNEFSMITAMGMLLVFVVVAAILDSRRELLCYVLLHFVFASVGPWTAENPEVTPWLYLISTITVMGFSVAVHVGRLKNERHRRKAEDRLQQVLGRLESEVAERTKNLQLSNELLLQEVANRRRAEKFLHARGRFLEGLSHGRGSLEELLEHVLLVIEEVNEGMLPSIMLLDSSASALNPAAAPSLPDFYVEALRDFPIGPDSGLCGAAVHYRRPMTSDDLHQEASCLSMRPLFDRAGLRACCSVPLLDSSGQPLGTLAVYYKEARGPDSIEMEFVKSCAHYMAAAIERYRTNEALELSRRRYHMATGAARVGVWDLNIQTMELYVDPMFKEILGYQDSTQDTIPLKQVRLVLPDADRRVLMKAARTNMIRSSRGLAVEHRARCRDGKLLWLSTRGAAIRDESGRPIRLMGTGTDITGFKTTELALQQNEAKFRSLSEAAFEGLLVLKGTRVLNANDKFCEMFGWQSEDVSGRDIVEFIAKDDASRLRACLESLNCGVMEFVAQHSFGASFPVEINASKFSQSGADLLVVAFRDLTERRRLERMTLQLDRFVQDANGPIFCVDSAGEVQEWNASLARLTGLERSRMLGKSIVELCVAPEDRDSVNAAFRRVRAGEAVANFEFSLLGSPGRRSRVLMNASPGPDRSGAMTTIWCMGQDITELSEYRRLLEQKVLERTQELLGALEKEKEIGDLRSRFVSMASHEFRTPLATIQTTADLLLHYADRIDRAKSNEYLDSILAEVLHMTELLDDILVFGQGEAGKFNFRPGPVDLQGLCEELIIKFARTTGDEERFELSCDISRSPSLDEKMVRLILSNLISNAIKYSPAGSPIRIHIGTDERASRIEVADSGIGIAEEDRARLFSPFHRGANVGNRSGTGLGLAIIKMAVEMHRGEIDFETRENHGTCVRIELPHAAVLPFSAISAEEEVLAK